MTQGIFILIVAIGAVMLSLAFSLLKDGHENLAEKVFAATFRFIEVGMIAACACKYVFS